MLSDEMRHKSNVEKIVFLSKLDFSADDIAEIVNTTVGTVRKEISIYKSKQVVKDENNNPNKP